MPFPNSLADFLAEMRVSQEQWERARIDWSDLLLIAQDYEVQLDSLRHAAELFAKVIQGFEAVHSVRWRVKDTSHLLEKIVRKRSESASKYMDISVENYRAVVTDLIGLRALHLFKDECFWIDEDLRSTWKLVERKPTAYIREGDEKARFAKAQFSVKEHKAGYRSIHYVCATQFTKARVIAEIQVRTIFEEGWSEIDHRIRYPNFSNEPLVSTFLKMFNRLAGSADEMGSFVRDLMAGTDSYRASVEEGERELAAIRHQLEEVTAQNRDQELNPALHSTLAAFDALVGDLDRQEKKDFKRAASQKVLFFLKHTNGGKGGRSSPTYDGPQGGSEPPVGHLGAQKDKKSK